MSLSTSVQYCKRQCTALYAVLSRGMLGSLLMRINAWSQGQPPCPCSSFEKRSEGFEIFSACSMGQKQAQGTGQRITFPVGEVPVGCTLRLHDLPFSSFRRLICSFFKPSRALSAAES